MRAEVPAGEEIGAGQEVLSSGDSGLPTRAPTAWRARLPTWSLALVVGLVLGLLGGWAWAERSEAVPVTGPPTVTVALGDGYLQGLNEEPREPTAYLDVSVINTGDVDLEVVAIRWGGLANRVEQPLSRADWVGVLLTTPVNCSDIVLNSPNPELPELVVVVRTSDGSTTEVTPDVVNEELWLDIAGQCYDGIDF